MLRTVTATRYVLPFHEGSSLPALMEADDDGLYVVKLRGAGQGPKALIAELLAGELAREAGLAVPEIVLVELSRALGTAEPDPEIAELLERSAGLNLGLDYLPGSITFDPVVGPAPDAALASRVVLFDAFVTNIDRTPKNPNLLLWHARLRLIDHGAALYFHHGWGPRDRLDGSRDPFPLVNRHVLLRWASGLPDAAAHLSSVLTRERVDHVVAQIPPRWLGDDDGFADHAAHRAAYGEWLWTRRAMIPMLAEEAARARSQLV